MLIITIRIIALCIALVSTVSRLVLSWNGADFGGHILSYFTIQSNIAVCIYLLCESGHTVLGKKGIRGDIFNPAVQGAILLYIGLTGVVFNTLLISSVEASGYDWLIMGINHTVTPLLFFTIWLLSQFGQNKIRYSWKYLGYWMIYPLLYVAFSSIEGIVTGDFLYFFLDFINYPPGVFLLQFLLVTSLFIVLGALIILLNRKLVTQLSEGQN